MKTGITGLPYSGKTTLFCALTSQDYESLGHGRDIHIGTVSVPDERLERLYDMVLPKKMTHATMEYFDIAGQSAGRDKKIEPKALQALRNAESLIVVLDVFSEAQNPRVDFDRLMEEFAFNDLVVVTNRLERLGKELKSGKSEELLFEKDVLERCRGVLEGGGVLRDCDFRENEEKMLRGFQFLSQKSLLIVLNISEKGLNSDAGREHENMFADIANSVCTSICAEIEMEIAMLDETDRPEFLESMGIEESALGRVVHLSYESLGLISFFTVTGNKEVRSWTVRKGANARECACVIHSDMERGFIRAETTAFDDLMNVGSFKAAREQGLLRIEGKDYIVQDGDVLTIRFNV